VDTTSLLAPDEGLLVGSSAHSLALVLAETGGTDLAPARPFRVNAGALHGYTLAPEGRTCYLSELAAGRQVLVASAAGGLRCVTVGRAKLERRPHLVLHWETEDGAASVALQAAETVRLAVPGGGSLAVTDARPGHAILVARQPEGRHAGIAVDETVEER
jgi:3-dehydroquinate synthase II